ncbi:30S ribosomal protein S20, chloroplastic [Ananas comosus]|uniref:Small ribosomal subunit protein bS20c n=1 Tax=Ananas comosus TaxID=4615 RepID=A0A199VQP5_ANACO|nr:30S ribosomal protein S20, chloroplastic [Ananas comosus]OAY79333.1 30S ribosomal protein S20, chloroplastic [Ananas comosus]
MASFALPSCSCSSSSYRRAKPFSSLSATNTISRFVPVRGPYFASLAFSSNLSLIAFPNGGFGSPPRAVEKPKSSPPRRSVVCEAAPKKADSAAKRARQAEKRRIYNKARKSEIKTRMRKVLEALEVLKKKADAQAEEILPIEKLIAEAYSVIDKAVKVGTLHRNTGAHRKSRLARRKKAVEIHHGWYTPAATV